MYFRLAKIHFSTETTKQMSKKLQKIKLYYHFKLTLTELSKNDKLS